MVTAIILIRSERTKVNDVAERLAEIPAISEVYSVGGRYDLVAVVRVKKTEQLAELVTAEMIAVDGILDTETLLAFRAYSRHDLDAVFSVGFEE